MQLEVFVDQLPDSRQGPNSVAYPAANEPGDIKPRLPATKASGSLRSPGRFDLPQRLQQSAKLLDLLGRQSSRSSKDLRPLQGLNPVFLQRSLPAHYSLP